MKANIAYLGIDIGGAHLKIVGIDKKKNVTFVNYTKCEVWKGISSLKEELIRLNSIIPHKSLCAITMTAELCDVFENRKEGFEFIKNECQRIKFNFFFYVNKKNSFSKIEGSSYEDIISMNWHSMGKFLENIFSNAILIDFGSTTTDFVLVKNGIISNKFFDDFSRLNNNELIYTGVIRTPIFGLQKAINYNGMEFKIIPEQFSTTSDLFRIKKKIKNSFDIDEELDYSKKKVQNSYQRVARSFGLDFSKNKKKLIDGFCELLIAHQLNIIKKNLKILIKKFIFKSRVPIVISGIGQDILYDFLKESHNTFLLENFLNSKNKNLKKKASYHAPALCIALLLEDKIE